MSDPAPDLDEFFLAHEVSAEPCAGCGGPVLEFAVPNDVWNRVVRLGRPETDREFLCLICFHRKVTQFVRAMFPREES